MESLSFAQVKSLEILSQRLYQETRNRRKPFVVGVTGSVGKTTTVAFLEHIAKASGIDVVRFYSKRLTPLSVMCHYINRVDVNTALIVMEYSAYLKDHVSQLSQVLPPDLAFLVNIYDTHINPGGFTSQKDIYDSKMRIRSPQTAGMINQSLLSSLNLELPNGWGSFQVETPDPGVRNPTLPPTLRTAELFTIGKLFAQSLDINEHIFREAYSTFNSPENRILSYSIKEINFADEDPQGFTNLLQRIFSSPKTFVLDTPSNRERLPVNANFVDMNKFRDILSRQAEGYIVYHKALATRKREFNPKEHLTNLFDN